MTFVGERTTEIDRGSGLPDPTCLVRDGDGLCHVSIVSEASDIIVCQTYLLYLLYLMALIGPERDAGNSVGDICYI